MALRSRYEIKTTALTSKYKINCQTQVEMADSFQILKSVNTVKNNLESNLV